MTIVYLLLFLLLSLRVRDIEALARREVVLHVWKASILYGLLNQLENKKTGSDFAKALLRNISEQNQKEGPLDGEPFTIVYKSNPV